MANPDKKELWIDWTHDAIGAYTRPDDIEAIDDVVDDMVEFSTKFADSMLDEYEALFEKSTSKRRKRKVRDEDEGDDE
jgi:hypothetical protein